jgi:phenylacetate-coenzyme A ligase PaaK-like adenylate-forming protein
MSQSDLDIHKSLRHKLSQKIKYNIGLIMNVALANYQSVPRNEGGKLNQVVVKRNK